MKIYFAGSVRGGRDNIEIYANIIQYLKKFGRVLTEHVGDLKISSKGEVSISEQQIFERDMEWLKLSDSVVAEVSTPSLGVGYELAIAEREGKPILCLCQSHVNLSAMISGNTALNVQRYTTFEEIKKCASVFFDRLSNNRRKNQV